MVVYTGVDVRPLPPCAPEWFARAMLGLFLFPWARGEQRRFIQNQQKRLKWVSVWNVKILSSFMIRVCAGGVTMRFKYIVFHQKPAIGPATYEWLCIIPMTVTWKYTWFGLYGLYSRVVWVKHVRKCSRLSRVMTHFYFNHFMRRSLCWAAFVTFKYREMKPPPMLLE